MLERALGVVRRVNKDALDLPPVKRQQGLEGLQVVALNEQVVLGRSDIAMDMTCRVRAQYMGCGVAGD
ncbi:MAG: hypothetical protein RLZ36_586 [Pseudomonadota bacterium]